MLLPTRNSTFARRMFCCLALILLAVVAVFGQGPTHSFEVSGVVFDPNGAVIAGAKVILRQKGGHSAETRTANQRGEFSFNDLAVSRIWRDDLDGKG
jgi:hypothetical protein